MGGYGDLDEELACTEAAIQVLERELQAAMPLKPTRKVPVARQKMSSTPAPRFPAGPIAEGGRALNPDRADTLRYRSAPRHAFLGTPQVAKGRGRVPQEPVEDEAEAHEISTFSARQPELVPMGRMSQTPRWNSASSGRRWRVPLRVSGTEKLGLVPDPRAPPGSITIQKVLPQSVLAAWNEACEAEDLQDLCVKPRDELVEVNGVRVDCPVTLRQVLEKRPEEVLLVFRRSSDQGPPCPEPQPLKPATFTRPGAKRSMAAANIPAVSTEAPAARRALAWAEHTAASEEEARVPGRCCRAMPFQPVLPRAPPPAAPAGCREERGTFGSEPRFGAEISNEPAPPLLCPSDHFLSTSAPARSAWIAPDLSVHPGKWRDAKRWLRKVAAETGSQAAVALAKAPGLRSLSAAQLAMLREELLAAEDDVSTDFGSERDAESSRCSSWGSQTAASEPPGPGAYSPDPTVVQPRLSRGVPSFSRYAPREPPQKDLEDSVANSRFSSAFGQELPEMRAGPEKTIPGGLIQPPHQHEPRAPTERMEEEASLAFRPFYNADFAAVDPSVPTPRMGSGPSLHLRGAETGRLATLEPTSAPGPGSYSMPSATGPSAVIAPPPRHGIVEVQPTPGPAEYTPAEADGLVYPRIAAADFTSHTGHTMEHQAVPDYVGGQQDLQPKWDLLLPRVPSAFIVPRSESPPQQRPPPVPPGPCDYEPVDTLTQRIRPDVKVGHWTTPSHGISEHVHALYTDHPVDRAILGDPRPLLGPEDDLPIRRRRPAAVIHPLPEPLRRSWSAGDHWHFYDPLLAPEPEGLASFSRRVPFEDFMGKDALWKALEERASKRERPNLRLTYSLPDLDLTKLRAPAVDFSKAPERPSSDPGDGSPREGDVLLLSIGNLAEMRYARADAFLDMARQRGREEALLSDPADDFEELVLSPKRSEERTVCHVNMDKMAGRREPNFLANVWAEDGDRVYTYIPSQLPQGDTLDVLDLGQAPPRLPLGGSFGKALGRPGLDLRVTPFVGEQEDALLTNWQPRFVPPPLPTKDESQSFVSGTE